MFYMLKRKKIYRAYASKYNSYHEKKVILLMISNRDKRVAKSDGCEAKSEGQHNGIILQPKNYRHY